MSADHGAPGGSGDYRLEIKTVQANTFKVLIEALKELLTDTTIEFDETGMKIMALDTSHVVMVHLKLEADKFEVYHCEGRIRIGINMLHLHKLIKTINNSSTLTLYIDRDDVNHIGIKVENIEKSSRTTYKLKLLDLDYNDINVPSVDFSEVITMPSVDFQKICRDMHNIADRMEIRSVHNQLIFACKGEFCAQETVISDNRGNDDGDIVQGVFNIRHLVLFTKCTNLCPTVDLHLKNDYALIISYDVSSLGKIKLALAPLNDI